MGNATGDMPPISADRRHRLADLILAESQRAGLGPGSRLPTERQLALDMGATRSSVRHALAVLQAEGHISREVGRGTFLRDTAPRLPGNGADGAGLALAAAGASPPLPPDGAGGFAPADVMTIRRLLEPLAMPLVVAWATAADFKEMDRCLAGGDQAASYDEFETWDLDLKRRSASRERRELYQADHAELVAALRVRDADRAVEAMRTHLGRVNSYLFGGSQ